MAKSGIFYMGAVSTSQPATYTPSADADYGVVTIYASSLNSATVSISGTGFANPQSVPLFSLCDLGADTGVNLNAGSYNAKCLVIGAGQTMSVACNGNVTITGIEHSAA